MTVNARAEAVARLGGRYDARVLEPSPPAVNELPWLADDPVGRDDPPGELPRVSPVDGANLRWEDLIGKDAELAEWCAQRWLAACRRLAAIPATLASTRVALHRLAEHVMSPARARANGKIGLRYTRGGFGTPFFADDVQVRVVNDRLIVQEGERERTAPITTLAQMAAHVGIELLPETPDGREPLEVDAEASAFLGDWYGFGASVLEELRASVGDELDPSRVQLWPEHFDLSVELGVERENERAAYGASPGDESHAEPYLYVAPWSKVPSGGLWQATAFNGAELSYAALRDARDQRDTALGFLRERLVALTADGQTPAE